MSDPKRRGRGGAEGPQRPQHRPPGRPAGLRGPGLRRHHHPHGRQCRVDRLLSRPPSPAPRNVRLAIICGVIFCGMVGAAFAAVPLYRAFCQATGFAGTVRRADAPPTAISDRTVEVGLRHQRARPGLGLPARTCRSQTARLGETEARLLQGDQHLRQAADRPRGLQRHARQRRRLLLQARVLLLQEPDAGAAPDAPSSRWSTTSIPRFGPTTTRSGDQGDHALLHLLPGAKALGGIAAARR